MAGAKNASGGYYPLGTDPGGLKQTIEISKTANKVTGGISIQVKMDI